MEYYLVYGMSESGDDYHLGLYETEPTEAELSSIIRLEAAQEIVTEDDVETSYLVPRVVKLQVKPVPAPDAHPLSFL